MKNALFDVVVIGEINADLIVAGKTVPRFGQVEQLVEDATLSVGSSSVIFASGASRLGLKTAFIGKVGKDIFGEFMIASMKERGIDVSGVIHDTNIKTGLSVILTIGSDRAILTYQGSIPTLNINEIDFSILERSQHLHLGSYFLLDNLRPDIPRLFGQAKKMELTVSLDTNYDPQEKWDGKLKGALKFVDILLPNETEIKAIASEEEINAAIEKLSLRVPILGIKLGRDGAMLKRQRNEPIHSNALSVSVVDTVGAGDSFDAGFIYGYLKGWEPVDILRFAIACGSLSTRSAGGINGQPNFEEAMMFASQLKK